MTSPSEPTGASRWDAHDLVRRIVFRMVVVGVVGAPAAALIDVGRHVLFDAIIGFIAGLLLGLTSAVELAVHRWPGGRRRDVAVMVGTFVALTVATTVASLQAIYAVKVAQTWSLEAAFREVDSVFRQDMLEPRSLGVLWVWGLPFAIVSWARTRTFSIVGQSALAAIVTTVLCIPVAVACDKSGMFTIPYAVAIGAPIALELADTLEAKVLAAAIAGRGIARAMRGRATPSGR